MIGGTGMNLFLAGSTYEDQENFFSINGYRPGIELISPRKIIVCDTVREGEYFSEHIWNASFHDTRQDKSKPISEHQISMPVKVTIKLGESEHIQSFTMKRSLRAEDQSYSIQPAGWSENNLSIQVSSSAILPKTKRTYKMDVRAADSPKFMAGH